MYVFYMCMLNVFIQGSIMKYVGEGLLRFLLYFLTARFNSEFGKKCSHLILQNLEFSLSVL